MKKGERITKEQIARMQELRSQGLSNSQISIEMGVSRCSVNRHIGPQPIMARADYGSICAYTHDKSFISPSDPSAEYRRPSSLVEQGSMTLFKGAQGEYTIDDVNHDIIIKTKDGMSCRFSYNEFQEFYWEIRYLHHKVNSIPQKPQTL